MANLPTLTELYAAHTGKVSDKWSSYLPTYDRLFAHLRDRPIRLMEIGVQNGGSLEIWAKYFPRARNIVGIDINSKCAELKFDDPRIQLFVQDATLGLNIQGSLDIIIDDGSHKPNDQIATFLRWFSVLGDGGIYVIEDMHCPDCGKAFDKLIGTYGRELAVDRRNSGDVIDRIEILNSMLVFIKGHGSLGPRVVAGQIEDVAPGHLGMNGTFRHG